MKFAHDFKDALSRQDYPPHWVESAIPYSQLKKILKKVARELNDLGLDPETLRQLLDTDAEKPPPLALKYGLKACQQSDFGNREESSSVTVAEDSNYLRPKLTVLVHLQDGIAVDASLSPSSRNFLERIALLQPSGISTEKQVDDLTRDLIASQRTTSERESEETATSSPAPEPAATTSEASVSEGSTSKPNYERIEVPLVCDGEFFDMLQTDVNALEALQISEEKAMTEEIVALGHSVSHLTKPSRLSKNDLTRWREIFELYLEAQVFFSTLEQDHGNRDSKTAARQLQWFQDEVSKRDLVRRFKMPQSRDALVRFLSLNAILLKNVQFQEINRLAIQKILKKFDKRTSLGVSKTFPAQIRSDKLLAASLARDVCAQVSSELVSCVPQLNDYLCPVCFAIAYRPVRLGCQHVFCIRCIVKIQRRNEKHCPLCRADVVMTATADNLDNELDRWLRKYFKKEVEEKAKANDLERGIEDFGPDYKPNECSIM